MTTDRSLKSAARTRAATTGTSYTQARRELLDDVPTQRPAADGPLAMRGHTLQVGERVQFAGSRRWWRVRAVSSTGRYVGLSSPENLTGTDLYTVIDRVEQVRGPDDRVFSESYTSDGDFSRRLAEFEDGTLKVSQRHRVDLAIVVVREADPRRKPEPPAALSAPDDLAPDPAGVVLAADGQGHPVRFDLTRGLRYFGGWPHGLPASVYRLLAQQARAAGREVHLVVDSDEPHPVETFTLVTRHPTSDLASVLRRAGTADIGLVVIAGLAPDMKSLRNDFTVQEIRAQVPDREGIDEIVELAELAAAATTAGTWMLLATSNPLGDNLMPHWPAALAFRYYDRRSAFGQAGVRKRLLAVDDAGLARLTLDGPLVPVRAYS